MTVTPEKVRLLVEKEMPLIGEMRRYLHAHPELSFEEKNTAEYISAWLSRWGIGHKTRMAGYVITGLLQGRSAGAKVVALRADMDALPIYEKNEVPYKSLNEGVMHACGHDVHMACLLGALKVLNEIRETWAGRIKFIFQPAEEKLPGGAKAMIEAGVLENPRPDVMIAQHVYPELEAGKAGFRPGKYMASGDEINLYVTGRGGHAAIASQFDNTVLALAEIIAATEQAVNSRSVPESPTILSFGKVVADGAHNIIPGRVHAHGTFRAFDEKWRQEAHRIIASEAEKIAAKHGCKAETVIDKGYPPVINDVAVTRVLMKAAGELLGEEQVKPLNIRMTVEDFGYYSQRVPSCFYRIGVANKKKGITAGLHTPAFDIDERSLLAGTALLVWNALVLLNER